MRFIRRAFGFLLASSSFLGLLGFPSDAPTWYRCLRGSKPCPESIANFAMTFDATKLWNIALLVFGIALVMPSSRLHRKPDPVSGPSSQFYSVIRANFIKLQYEGLELDRGFRSAPEDAPGVSLEIAGQHKAMRDHQAMVEWGTKVARDLHLYFPGGARYFTAPPQGQTVSDQMNCYLSRLAHILEDTTNIIERPQREAMSALQRALKDN